MIPLGFLAPLALAGLALVAGPIAIHMLRRARTRRLEFPSLRFLRETPIMARALAAPDRWLLLILRVLFVALVALAFARPVWIGGAEPATSIVLLLDASVSMRQPGARDAALAAARQVVERLGPNDRLRAAAFGASVEWLGEAGAPAGALAPIDRYEAGFGRARPADALAEAERYLSTQPEALRRIVVISDFQASNGPWTATAVDPSIAVEPIRVGGAFETAYVDGVTFVGAGDAARARVGVVRASEAERRVETVTVGADGAGAAGVRIEGVDGGWRASVTSADGLDADDARFVAAPAAGDVVVVEPGPAAAYLLAAVSAATESGRRADRVDAGALEHAGRAVLTNRALPETGAVAALETWVRDGHEAVVFAVGQAEWRFPSVAGEASRGAGLVRVGADDARGELDDALLRASVDGLREVAAAEGDEVLLRAADGRPVAVRRPMGAGGVTVVGFDPTPERAPFVLTATFPDLVAWLVATKAGREVEVGDRVAGIEGPVRTPGLVRGSAGWIAVNVPRAESDPSRLDDQSVSSVARDGAPSGATSALAEVERRQRLWWFLLLAATGLGLAELAVALRGRRQTV